MPVVQPLVSTDAAAVASPEKSETLGAEVTKTSSTAVSQGYGPLPPTFPCATARKRQPVEIVPFSRTTPSVAAVRSESFLRLHEAIATLSESHREVIRLLRFEEIGVPEAARRLERSENAIRILYCRALKALREAFPMDRGS